MAFAALGVGGALATASAKAGVDKEFKVEGNTEHFEEYWERLYEPEGQSHLEGPYERAVGD